MHKVVLLVLIAALGLGIGLGTRVSEAEAVPQVPVAWLYCWTECRNHILYECCMGAGFYFCESSRIYCEGDPGGV